jgi:hypothetical protein
MVSQLQDYQINLDDTDIFHLLSVIVNFSKVWGYCFELS